MPRALAMAGWGGHREAQGTGAGLAGRLDPDREPGQMLPGTEGRVFKGWVLAGVPDGEMGHEKVETLREWLTFSSTQGGVTKHGQRIHLLFSFYLSA